MNKFTNTRIEFHILQSFPVSCLNRDDVGSPKSAIIGGVERARVSSQCWKRAVRTELQKLGVVTAERTKLVTAKIAAECIKLGASAEEAEKCGNDVASQLTSTDKDGKKGTLLFLSDDEILNIATQYKQICLTSKDGKDKKNKSKKISEDLKKIFKGSKISLDIALFGRMVAQIADLNIEAAASFAHAISTHKVSSEIDFFTAVDDADDAPGSAHMGLLEFNSATYYRYISLDLGQLADNLRTEEIGDAVEAFAKALFIAYPSARQTTMAAMCPWNYALVTCRKGQGIQLPFNQPVRPGMGEDMVSASIAALQQRFEEISSMYGSLFNLQNKFEVAPGKGNIDDLIVGLRNQITAM